MTWAPLLLADPSPCLRILVLRDLLKRPESDFEVQELRELRETDPIVQRLLALQSEDGSWYTAYAEGNTPGGSLQATSQALTSLGYLGFDFNHSSVLRGAEFLFSKQLTDGAWPTGRSGEIYGFVAGYRRLAHSRWGCRSNTTASLICLAHHPSRRFSMEARRALDLLLGRETRERQNVGFEVARIIGVEPPSGYITYFARFDLALILDLCWRVGVDYSDERVTELVKYIQDAQGSYGLWEYIPRPEASHWITFDLLRSLSHLDEKTDWLSLEPRTPFKAYPKKPRRF